MYKMEQGNNRNNNTTQQKKNEHKIVTKQKIVNEKILIFPHTETHVKFQESRDDNKCSIVDWCTRERRRK